MSHGGDDGFECLSGEDATGTITDSEAEHDRHFKACDLHRLLGSVESGLGIEGVEESFEEESINASTDECCHLFLVGGSHFIEGDGAESGIADVRTHGERFVRGANRAHDKTGTTGCLGDGFACQTHSGRIDFLYEVFAVVVGE